ncbi:MAG: SAM-dependent methyltransferase, partial [Burkholderiaceae bacterium]
MHHAHGNGQPSPWVARFAALIPAGEVLDLACGGGRHARLLAARGHRVL